MQHIVKMFYILEANRIVIFTNVFDIYVDNIKY